MIETTAREKLLTPAEVAEWLGVSEGWIRDHATRRDPRLPAVKIGRLLRFRESEVAEWLKAAGVAA
jgi:excisionase family DNA binding protein